MVLKLKLYLLLLLLPLGLRAGELEDYLSGYVGRWSGHFTIHSTATDYSESFPVEQLYWWVGDQLHGVAVSERDSGMESARSVTSVVDGQLVSEISRGEQTERFVGVLHDGGLLWVPADLQRANDYQIKESLVEKDGKRVLKTEGFDSYVYQEGLAYIVYRGELVYQETEE